MVIEIETALQIGGRLIIGAPPIEIIYWLFLTMATAAVVLLAVIRYSRFGSGLRAIQSDEVAAETIGVPTVKYKVVAFAISAIIPGLVGGIMLMRSGYLEPDTIFDPTVSLTMICIAVIGGGNTPATALLGSVSGRPIGDAVGAISARLYDPAGMPVGHVRASGAPRLARPARRAETPFGKSRSEVT